MTTEQAYNDFLDKLEQIYERSEAANIADWIFENVTGLKKLERRVHKNELNEQAGKQIENYMYELLQHKPVQYVLHEAWFYKMKFFVNEHVLIPRPETEELVSWVVDNVRSAMCDVQCNEHQLLDIGTGSGCIAISLKKELPHSHITAIDVSREALTVAKRNADVLQAQIDFLKINFLDESLWDSLTTYDVIVSNPPYIPGVEKEKLAKNVTGFEPGIALFVPDNSPFIFYEKIAKFAQLHLKPGGNIFVEMHEDYSREVAQIFIGNNFKTAIKEDIYGKKRMIKIM
ncbi:MAG: peptide chain release factor N(5)-glutamine methyltransferase [Ginsengibacter sp.]